MEDTTVVEYKEKDAGEKQPKAPPPKDLYKICHVVFFFLGVCHFLPITFFSAANNFWMHKFRNISDPDALAENRTFLQKNFASAMQISNTIPSLIFGILNVTHSHRIKIKTRIISTLFIEVIIFLIITISVKVDTDDFQAEFFGIVLISLATLAGANTVNIVASMNLYTRFPLEYMKTAMIGEGTAGIVGDLINVLTIWIFGSDVTSAALMYFIVGSVVVLLTFILNVLILKTKFFNYHLESVPEKVENKMPGKEEIISAFFKIRFTVALVVMTMISYAPIHSSVTALVVSEQDSTTSGWAKNYFSPVMTFLLADTFVLLGRAVCSYIPMKIPENLFLIITAVRTAILVPFILLCNAQPRSNLLVLFPHDYQYAIILATLMFTTGYYITLCSLYIRERIPAHEGDLAFTLLGLFNNVIQAILSPLGTVIVNSL